MLAVATASATAALVGALLVARSVIGPVDRVRRASEELAGGDLGARAPEHGPGEPAELGAAFNRMASELELLDARRQLVAHASHDLRTPLASLQDARGHRGRLAPPERYLPAMHDQVRHLSRLVDDLFELARIDAGALTLELREWRSAAWSGCVRGVEARARARGVRLESRVAGGVPPVRGAPDQLERVLLNLITNALRHTPSDGAVAVLVQADGDEVRVSVEDTGDGRARVVGGGLRTLLARGLRAAARRRRAGPAWAWPSPAAWSRRRAGGSGPRRGRRGARVSFALLAAGTRRLASGAPRGASTRPAAAPVGRSRRGQYHFPLTKPPKAMRPTRAMMSPIQKLQTNIRMIPMMTMMPPRPIPPMRMSLSAMPAPCSRVRTRTSSLTGRPANSHPPRGRCRQLAGLVRRLGVAIDQEVAVELGDRARERVVAVARVEVADDPARLHDDVVAVDQHGTRAGR